MVALALPTPWLARARLALNICGALDSESPQHFHVGVDDLPAASRPPVHVAFKQGEEAQDVRSGLTDLSSGLLSIYIDDRLRGYVTLIRKD